MPGDTALAPAMAAATAIAHSGLERALEFAGAVTAAAITVMDRFASPSHRFGPGYMQIN